MPITAIIAVLAALSMSGIPPFLGFVGKELIYEATQESHLTAFLVTSAAVITNILTVVAAGLVVIRPFFGVKVDTPKHAHETPWSMLLGPVILAALGLIVGLLVAPFGQIIVEPAVSGILAEHAKVKLHLVPNEVNLTVMLSAITIVAGFGLYFIRDTLYRATGPLNVVTRWGPEQWYRWTLDGTLVIARYQTRILQSGYLRYYLATVILTTAGVAGYTLVIRGELNESEFWRRPTFNFYEVPVYLMILAATLVVVRTKSRLAAVAALGVVGYGMALIFILFGAPDLAMTQFSIETLSVILLVLVLYKLPRFAIFSRASQHLRDAMVALAGGALMTLLILIVTALPSRSRLTPFFAENSLLGAKGHNVVNVILVDFRAFDTMGEITVLGVAALGVYGLLKLRLDKSKQTEQEQKLREQSQVPTDVYPTTVRQN
jgi:multicomponent Na+:H+ antiporter subunit A